MRGPRDSKAQRLVQLNQKLMPQEGFTPYLDVEYVDDMELIEEEKQQVTDKSVDPLFGQRKTRKMNQKQEVFFQDLLSHQATETDETEKKISKNQKRFNELSELTTQLQAQGSVSKLEWKELVERLNKYSMTKVKEF